MLSTTQQKLKILPLVFLFFGFFALNASAAVINKPPSYLSSNNGLVGYWTMDGSKVNWKTGAVTDSSGRGNTGTITNMATSTGVAIGKVGQALNFDGVDDYVNAGSAANLDNLTAISASAWVYARSHGSSNGGSIITKRLLNGSAGWQLTLGLTNALTFLVDHATTDLRRTTSNSTLSFNAWHHVVVIWDGSITASNIHIYVDGVEASYQTTTNGADARGNDNTAIGNIGSLANGGFGMFDGLIDEVRVYNRALGANEIKTLYNSGAAKFNVSPTKYLTDGLVGYWTMDGSKVNWKTGAVTDSSGRGNTGTITNMATSTGVAIGKVGQALNFDGVDDYVNTGSGSALDNIVVAGGMTVSAWIYPRSEGEFGAGAVTAKTSTGGNNGWMINFGSGLTNTLGFNHEYSTTNLNRIASNNSVTLNSWQHVLVTWDGSSSASNVHIYINGVEKSYQTTTNGDGTRDDDNLNILGIGARDSGGLAFDGLIDEVRIYNRALAASEIQTLYNSGAAKFNVSPTKYLTDGLVGYWTMDGSKVNWATGAVTDSSGRGNTGTITNMATSTGVGAGKIGQAIKFDGVDDYVTTSDLYDVGNDATKRISISFWYYAPATASTREVFVQKAFSSVSGSIDYTVNRLSNQILWGTGSSTDTCAFKAITEPSRGQWHHIVATLIASDTNAGTKQIFVDGSLKSTCTYATKAAANNNPVELGTQSAGTWLFKGKLDEVRIYNRALSANEVLQLYNAGR